LLDNIAGGQSQFLLLHLFSIRLTSNNTQPSS
jgi:hypothetical protein